MTAEIKDINVRGCEKNATKNGTEYLRVNVEDPDAEQYVLLDYDTGRESRYIRGEIFDFVVRIRRNVWQGKERLSLEIIEAKDTGENEYADKK